MPPTMRICSRSNTRAAHLALLLGAAWAGLSAGCAVVANPFRDEMQPAQRVTTASVEGARLYDGAATPLTRPGEPISVAAKSGAVRHLTVYFEDPIIEEGSDDGRTAWTIEDYFQFLAWQPGRFLVETLTWPAQALIDLPWVVHVSDGVRDKPWWDGHYDVERDRG